MSACARQLRARPPRRSGQPAHSSRYTATRLRTSCATSVSECVLHQQVLLCLLCCCFQPWPHATQLQLLGRLFALESSFTGCNRFSVLPETKGVMQSCQAYIGAIEHIVFALRSCITPDGVCMPDILEACPTLQLSG